MEIRQGQGADDAAAIAALIWETDPEMCAFVFGSRERWESCCTGEWRADYGLHAHPSALLAVDGGRPVGLLIAYPDSEMAPRYAATLARYESAIAQRMETVGWFFPVLPAATLYVFNLAVAPVRRGEGLGRRLLAAAETRARAAGLAAIHLDVAASAPSVSFYERLGFRPLARTALLDPPTHIPEHLRMVKPLRAA